MHTVVYVSVESESVRFSPVIGKEPNTQESKKRKFLRKMKDTNESKTKKPVSRGCFNCRYHLSKYYYWKQCPCDSCLRSPAFYYHLPSMDLVDQWVSTPSDWVSRRNLL